MIVAQIKPCHFFFQIGYSEVDSNGLFYPNSGLLMQEIPVAEYDN